MKELKHHFHLKIFLNLKEDLAFFQPLEIHQNHFEVSNRIHLQDNFRFFIDK